ncbi:MAG: hypothetical protein Q9160_004183 [Pyrenula sp. 1 TL-2023]
MDRRGAKRSRSRSPPSYRRPEKAPRASNDWSGPRGERFGKPHSGDNGNGHQTRIKEQTRLNQLQEDERMRDWVAKEDDFVLKQRKKKADIRVREGRAQPIDKLTVVLRALDPCRDHLDDDFDDEAQDIYEPVSVVKGLSLSELISLERDIETYLHLETAPANRDYWRDYKRTKGTLDPEGRAMSSVAADIDKILSSKTFRDLERLEEDIKKKLGSNEPIDTDYWEQLLKRLLVWKAKSRLQKIYQTVVDLRLQKHNSEQDKASLQPKNALGPPSSEHESNRIPKSQASNLPGHLNKPGLDPYPAFQDKADNQGIEVTDESTTTFRHAPFDKGTKGNPNSTGPIFRPESVSDHGTSRFAPVPMEDFSQATKALYEKEVAKGINEDEEIFTGEESVDTKSKPMWANKYRPRKPRYFNRVQMGYEWNKYNQTHYDHDNPPPKVVQGYKFNIFYPDLIDKMKAPTYKIEREGGRKRGQSFAPAGEEDTCLIRFISGPPYEDIAFRIVDKEWDYSAKRERGFKSSFDKVCNVEDSHHILIDVANTSV